MNDDTISRKAAIDAMGRATWAINRINELPPAQQEKRTEEHTETHACDLISRQEAIDAVKWGITYARAINTCTGETKELFKVSNYALNEAVERLKELPSAQPEVLACGEGELIAQPEIIQCKDCKHKGTKNCVANAWTTIFGVMVKDDFYCGLAERRTDDGE